MNPTRITAAIDERTANLLEEMREEMNISQSELMRRAIQFYHENKDLLDLDRDKFRERIEMLSSGEHVILDVDHWLLFLKFMETHQDKEDFWKQHEKIAISHAEQLSNDIKTAKDLLERLEFCNFFRLVENTERDFTLVLSSETPRKFVKIFIESFLSSIGLKTEIKEDIGKIRVKLL
ncbi:MAG: Ribbon-helix-helix protein, copG family [Candidatus Methanolliviera sp. GoM_asphalt]|nr:MAG: Ribbon-helix-helix protein, copG family [Candidatus Methanolliviera sp. GoM_asphalt]